MRCLASHRTSHAAQNMNRPSPCGLNRGHRVSIRRGAGACDLRSRLPRACAPRWRRRWRRLVALTGAGPPPPADVHIRALRSRTPESTSLCIRSPAGQPWDPGAHLLSSPPSPELGSSVLGGTPAPTTGLQLGAQGFVGAGRNSGA